LVQEESVEGVADDFFCGHVEGFLGGEFGGGAAHRGVSEAGFDGSGANGEDADPVAAKFEAECFAEAGHVSLACGVDREVRDREEAGERTEIENSTPPGDEAGKEGVGEMGQGLHVEADHLPGLLPIGGTKLSVVAHAGIVEQAVGVKVFVGEGVEEMVAPGRVGKVAGDNFDLEGRVGFNEFFGEFLEEGPASGGENEGLDAGRELNGILPSESGAGARNESAVDFRIRSRHFGEG